MSFGLGAFNEAPFGDVAGEGAAATAITLSGPSSGTNNVASSNFTVGADGAITGTVVFTPTSSAGTGSFTPTTVSISSGSPTGTFTYTPTSAGARNINGTNDGGLSAPANVAYTANDFVAVTLTDTFNRSDQSNLGTSSQGTWSWSIDDLEVDGNGLIDIVSNQASQNSANTLCLVRAESDLASSDNYAQVSIVTRGTADSMAVCCRMSTGAGPSSYLGILLEASDHVALYKNTGASNFVQIGSNVAVTVSLPQVLKVQAVGTTIKVFWDGVEKISATDSAVGTGLRSGLRVGAGGATQRVYDSFEAGDVVSGSAIPVLLVAMRMRTA